MEALVGTLPIATRQLVAICRALAAQARLVVMDEPTASLTHQEVEALLATIHELKRQNIATVFVSHRLDEVMTLPSGSPCSATAAILEPIGFGILIAAGWANSSPVTSSKAASSPASPAMPLRRLEARRLTCAGQYADISLELRPGEILGLTGRLGSGRTELALSLFGMNPPDSGEIRVNGKPRHLRSNRDAIRQGIAYVSEDRLSLGLVMPQTIADNTVISVLDRLTGPLGSHRWRTPVQNHRPLDFQGAAREDEHRRPAGPAALRR